MENFISRQLLSKESSESLSESIKMFSDAKTTRERKKYSFEVSIFLSHKHDETEIIKQAIALFKKLGISVYVDWLDSEMPKTTNGYTAKRIKERIRECDKFVFLATEKAIQSKWCNWELGYGDSQKYFKDIAVMPITDTEAGTFSGSEYLAIYPIITSAYNYSTGTYYVEFEGKKVSLAEWLKN